MKLMNSLNAVNVLTAAIVFWSFSYYYLGDYRGIGVIFYILFILVSIQEFNSRRVDARDRVLLVAIILLFFIALFIHENIFFTLYSIRLFFGFSLFILWFRLVYFPDIFKIVTLFSCSVIVEKILIIIFPSLIHFLPNYSLIHFSVDNAASIIAGVHGFGGGRTVTGVICLSSFFFVRRNSSNRGFLPLMAALISGSGTVYFILFGYLVIKYLMEFFTYAFRKNLKQRNFLFFAGPIVGCLILILLFLTDDNGAPLYDRFSSSYFERIFFYKIDIIDKWIANVDLLSLLFGQSPVVAGSFLESSSFVGDFAIMDLLYRFGSLGTVIFFLSMIFYVNSNVASALLVLILGSLHYHVLFSVPGSLFTALIICYRRNSTA
jgi:hypothetical protein